LSRDSRKNTTLSVGDYISYRVSQKGRVNGIFCHELLQNPKRVFLHVTPITRSVSTTDGVLNLPIYEIQTERDEIVGLPAVTAVKLYMIAVSTTERPDGGTEMRLQGNELVHCT
jgi:hypothetical protein